LHHRRCRHHHHIATIKSSKFCHRQCNATITAYSPRSRHRRNNHVVSS
jgi:hypothetical protein